jgi:hypothetical protein
VKSTGVAVRSQGVGIATSARWISTASAMM